MFFQTFFKPHYIKKQVHYKTVSSMFYLVEEKTSLVSQIQEDKLVLKAPIFKKKKPKQ